MKQNLTKCERKRKQENCEGRREERKCRNSKISIALEWFQIRMTAKRAVFDIVLHFHFSVIFFLSIFFLHSILHFIP
jgi:hypothetical protein